MTRDEFMEIAPKLENNFKGNTKYVKQFMLDAFDAHAQVTDETHAIVFIDEFKDVNPEYCGLFISIYREFIAVWIAIDDKYGLRDGLSIGDYPIDIGFSNLVSKCKNDVDVCPKCGKRVGLANMKQYSFAGRCCPDCLPGMQEKHEQPGWYN